MRKTLSNLLAPHYCCSCGEIGAILCSYCKYSIVSEPHDNCLVCGHPVGPKSQLCDVCCPPYVRAWCVGRRDDGLRAVIDALKFERTRAAYLPLAELLDEVLPVIPSDVTVVPVPTLTYHKRVRGYGHIELVAKAFAKKRGLPYAEVLIRRSRHVQRGAARARRIAQAKETYMSTALQKGQTYLLVDDVYTTGATLEYASRALIAGGAGQVWVAALSRQPLEK